MRTSNVISNEQETDEIEMQPSGNTALLTAPEKQFTRTFSAGSTQVVLSKRTQLMQLTLDAGLVATAFVGAYLLRFQGALFDAIFSPSLASAQTTAYLHQIEWALPSVVAIQLLANWACGVYRRSWSRTGAMDLLELAVAVFTVTAGLVVVRSVGLLSIEGNQLSFAIIFMSAVFSLVLLVTPRMLWHLRAKKRDAALARELAASAASFTSTQATVDIASALVEDLDNSRPAGVSDGAHIKIKNASLKFRLYHNPSPNLKETFVDKIKRTNHNTSTEFDALKNINLEIYPGDRLGIVGLNGAGKSTLLKMIVGIYPAFAGDIEVQGKVTPLIELGTGFDHELSGRENIYLNGALLGRSYKQMRSLEAAIIEFSELGEKIDLPIKYYSSGMHARLAFSIGAICDPEILLMDEVFATGDAHFIEKSMNRLHQMMEQSQILVLVSHDSDHIIDLCNRAIVLNKGEIVLYGTPEEAIEYYMTEIVHSQTYKLGDALKRKLKRKDED